jgi:hypothetical protein
VLFLEDVPSMERLALMMGAGASRARSPLQAAWALAGGETDVIVVGPKARWAHDMIAVLPAARRPAVVAVGEETPCLFGLVDRWLEPGASNHQVDICLESALGEARQRTESGETRWIDAETGLPTRLAFIGALVRRARRAQIDRVELSVVVTRIGGESIRAAALLASGTRRSEITGRADADQFVTLIHGSDRMGQSVCGRFESQLAHAGISARAVCHQMRLDDVVEHFARATERASGPRSLAKQVAA